MGSAKILETVHVSINDDVCGHIYPHFRWRPSKDRPSAYKPVYNSVSIILGVKVQVSTLNKENAPVGAFSEYFVLQVDTFISWCAGLGGAAEQRAAIVQCPLSAARCRGQEKLRLL